MFRRPLYGRKASVQHSLDLHLRLVRNVSVEAGVRAKLFSYKKAFITNTRPFFIHIFIIFFNKFLNYI